MPAGSSHSTSMRLKLTMPAQDKRDQSDKGQQQGSTSSPSADAAEHESSVSPRQPSYSPVTPTLSQASLASQDDLAAPLAEAQWMDEPPESLPVSLNDNPDAIALRATLSILQIQRQQALQDIRDLDRLKAAALERPEEFVEDLKNGKLNRPPRTGVDVDDLDEATEETDASSLGRFPLAQNVVRTPPIEWTKYHIVGEPLDRIHQIQQKYPGVTEEMLAGPNRPQPHKIAAPYRPFADKLEETKAPASSK